ncbi:energy-coupling factor transporter transmembrane protein EcfT [Rhodococcus triatomae]|uniref:Biotin transport system permease protein n=1 Tax=Rhodococcus triatomae TaxID=300028 RepID=A0A1G8MXN6_9NOCA|nr:energy-coupling factor transporter transmembrane component T [Rhodococcus triatomae]QNG19124.1 energy-coupling factor transporter transmembrane protein EcfT [Rhodococcus triatomae]QNG24963.1 energy-coupling factor transporter transmembrane protein EcfT [Rhodococcus triatomae]SDI72768.1 biotin transport system permease protein [Rhodococcus triatomae]
MTTLGIYRPGTTIVHRVPAGPKVALLVVLVVAVTAAVRSPWHVIPAAAVVVGLYALARIGPRAALDQLRPLLWMMVIIGAFQWIFTGWQRAVVVCGSLLVAVALAALVSLTTRVSDMLDALTRGLAPLGRLRLPGRTRGAIDPERVALVLAMTIRAVPLLAGIVRQVSDAHKARGARFSLRAFAVPVVVGTLMTADAMGEALAARGADD